MLVVSPLVAQDAASIMARVAAHQDQSEAERAHYVYVQHARVVSRKGKTVRCEETTDTRVTPTATGSSQQMLKLDGRLLVKHAYVTYDHLPGKKDLVVEHSDEHTGIHGEIENDEFMDRDLVENMRDNLTNTKSKDGIGAGLFPLTSKTQAEYVFTLVGNEMMNGLRSVSRQSSCAKDRDEDGWMCDASCRSHGV